MEGIVTFLQQLANDFIVDHDVAIEQLKVGYETPRFCLYFKTDFWFAMVNFGRRSITLFRSQILNF